MQGRTLQIAGSKARRDGARCMLGEQSESAPSTPRNLLRQGFARLDEPGCGRSTSPSFPSPQTVVRFSIVHILQMINAIPIWRRHWRQQCCEGIRQFDKKVPSPSSVATFILQTLDA